ncbi:hypothetical protein [Streptomyces sp. NBC_01304]|uniref:hypothetical protein n=1 Tax=Streptomyces sp. NBC_01304 TaxID=2903818 RepID=UPI002E123B02|nr:hypothetical protein OG430_27540 [Streptomyces sp. NBC_01304]
MGIESDQLVFDYLSRVGDLAQQRKLPSGTRMRLVNEARAEIERRRAKAVGDGPAGVRRILGRLGTPEELVDRAAGAGPADLTVIVPEQRADEAEPSSRRLLRKVPGPRAGRARTKAEPEVPDGPSPTAAMPPHLAGADELGASGSEPDWWRVDSSPFGPSDSVPGFVGGVEIPEILRPPREKPEKSHEHEDDDEFEEEAGEGEGDEEFDEGEEAPVRRRRFLRLRRGGFEGEERGGARLANPILLFAALALVAGAVRTEWWPALGIGWVLAYTSRRLGPLERKFAVLGLPGLVAAGGVVWLWGRVGGRWGEAVPEDGMRDALEQTLPWVVRVAAVASALFLVWRSQRQRPE